MAEQERILRTENEIRKKLHQLEEESHQKDSLLQSALEEDEKKNAHMQDLQAQLAKAEASYKELSECNEDLIRNQHKMVQEQLQQKTKEMEKMQQEVQAKTAQVKQYKKQIDLLQEEQQKPQEATEEVEDVGIFLVHVQDLYTLEWDSNMGFHNLCYSVNRSVRAERCAPVAYTRSTRT